MLLRQAFPIFRNKMNLGGFLVKQCRMYQRSSPGTETTSAIRSERVIDLRSDTVTLPSDEMRDAMRNAKLGDDVFKEDPTVNELETKCAAFFGTEAALFVPSGTMGNLISLMLHCNRRGDQIIVGSKQHIFTYEQGNFSQFGGISSSVLPNNPDGTITLDAIRGAIRDGVDFHESTTRLICLENTHNACGGRVLPLEYLSEVKKLAVENKLAVHIDGARIANAAVALRKPVRDIVHFADSVSMCFSKGLGCPVGSAIGGSKDFIEGASRVRKAIGGAWRQAGVLAAAALVALQPSMKKELAVDHANAKKIADGINGLHIPNLNVDTKILETNMIILRTPTSKAAEICELLRKNETSRAVVLCEPLHASAIRLVTHWNIYESDIPLIIEAFAQLKSHFAQ